MTAYAGRIRTGLAGLTSAATLALGATGCGSSASLSAPTGVDQLVIPTPSPRPDDFVAGVDNPWLGWEPGARQTYVQTGSADAQPVTVTVSRTTTPVAGLEATTVTTTGPDAITVDWYAEDRGGNVWWLGREGEWTAGESGAQAGLWMPADPRVGDGFRLALEPGVVEDRAEVQLPQDDDAAGVVDGELRLDVRSDLEPAVLTERTYVEGRGLVREVRAGVAGDSYVRTRQAD